MVNGTSRWHVCASVKYLGDAKVIRHPQPSPVCVTQWSTYLEDLHARVSHRFFRPEVSQRAYRYLSRLLADEMSLEDECVEGAFSEIRNGWRA